MIDINIVNLFGSSNSIYHYVAVELFLDSYYESIILSIAL